MPRDSDPRLVALFAIFTRLTWDEDTLIEEIRAGPVRRLIARRTDAVRPGRHPGYRDG